MLAVAALTAVAPPAAQAQSAAKHARITNVPCNTTALANAIIAANTVPATLRLAGSCVYLLTAALPQVTGKVTLVGGPSTSIKRSPIVPNIRILDVATTGTLRVDGIFILGGAATTGVGGGIRNAGSLVLNRSTLGGNTVTANNGGGLHNTGVAVLVRTLFAANSNQGPAGDGGAIYNDGSLTLLESRLVGNIATRNGGGIYTTPTHTTRIIQSTVSGNSAANLGGGLYNNGTTSLDRSVVALNQAVGSSNGGGGIFNSAGTVTLSRSMVTKNSPDNCQPLNSILGCTG
jgi:parallel beta-helix repeat protein